MSTAIPKFEFPTSEDIKDQFRNCGRLTVLEGPEAWDKRKWPKGAGVYLIWRVDGDERQLLYIGKAGKFRRSKKGALEMNGSNFAGRLSRYTPYCFQPEKDTLQKDPLQFAYGPNDAGGRILYLTPEKRYKHSVPADKVQVECFCLKGMESSLSPALLESLLLQNYLSDKEDLPIANNEL